MATPRRSPQALPLVIEYGGRTDIGLSRLENQDAWAKFPPSTHALEGGDGHLFVVADGMGGHERGAEASRLAVQTMREAFYADPSASAAERTRGGIEAANARIHALTCAETPPFKMGTTCTVLALVGTDAGAEAVVAHVGDSRLYRVRGGRIEQLTRDHTRVAELQRHGVLREDEVQAHPARTVLTRAVGAGPTVDVDVEGPILLQPGDVFVLCSDGLARVLPDEVRDVALTRAPQPACDALVALANERGGDDNVTVVVVRVGADDDATMTGPAPRSISEPRSSPARLTRPRRAAPRGWVVGAVIAGLVALGAAGLALRRNGERPAPRADAVPRVADRDARMPEAAVARAEDDELTPDPAAPAAGEPAPNASAAGEPTRAPTPAVGADAPGRRAPAAVLPDGMGGEVGEGDRLMAAGEVSTAVTRYQNALQNDPLNLGAIDGLNRAADHYGRAGDAARTAGDCGRALALYEQAMRLRPGDAGVRAGVEACAGAG